MKTTDTIALRVCLPFSWWRTRDAETQMTLIKPEKNGVPAYVAALCREIESLGRDMQEYRVVPSGLTAVIWGYSCRSSWKPFWRRRIARSI